MPDRRVRITPDSKAKIGNAVSDLNIVLTKAQINDIVRSVIGVRGERFDPRAIASDYCCVDASVGSSVAGPVSSVASSVSIPNPEGRLNLGDKLNIIKQDLQQKLESHETKINIAIPTNVTLK